MVKAGIPIPQEGSFPPFSRGCSDSGRPILQETCHGNQRPQSSRRDSFSSKQDKERTHSFSRSRRIGTRGFGWPNGESSSRLHPSRVLGASNSSSWPSRESLHMELGPPPRCCRGLRCPAISALPLREESSPFELSFLVVGGADGTISRDVESALNCC